MTHWISIDFLAGMPVWVVWLLIFIILEVMLYAIKAWQDS